MVGKRQIFDIDRTHKIARLGGVTDVNTAMLVYLRDRYAEPTGDLTTLLTRYLNTETTAPTATARFQLLIQDALAANGDDAMLHPATLLLNNDQIKALPTTGAYQIVAAPGAGKVNIPQLAALYIDGSVSYTGSFGNDGAELGISWAQGFSKATQFLQNNLAAGIADLATFLDNAALGWPQPRLLWPSARVYDPAAQLYLSPDDGVAAGGIVNGSLDLFCQTGGADFGGGDAGNTLRVSMLYYTWNIATGLFE